MRVLGGVVAVVSFALCTPALADTWVELKISRVQAKPTKVDGGKWDGAEEKSSGCGPLISAAAKLAGPQVGLVATLLCAAPTSQKQRDATAPDLFVQVVAGDAKYPTPITPDTFAAAPDYSVLVPVEGVPAGGLAIQVFDQDADVGSGELIGLVRVTKQQLHAALSGETPLISMSDGQLDRIEIEVMPYEARSTVTTTFDVSTNLSALSLKARAGELVTISASGTYSVANDKTQINVNGYPEDKRAWNRKDSEFANSSHGMAIAYIGAPAETRAAVVVGGCASVVAPFAGAVHVGINDDDFRNNEGSVVFTVTTGLPTIAQWRSVTAPECNAPKSEVAGANVPEALDRGAIASAIASVKARVLECGSGGSAKGTVKVQVKVNGSGAVTNVVVVESPDATLGACVATKVVKATFPVTRSGGSFSYPFTF